MLFGKEITLTFTSVEWAGWSPSGHYKPWRFVGSFWAVSVEFSEWRETGRPIPSTPHLFHKVRALGHRNIWILRTGFVWMCVLMFLVMCLHEESLSPILDSVCSKCLPRVCFLLRKRIPQKSNENTSLNKIRNIKMLIQGKIEQLWKCYIYFSYSIILVSYPFSSCLFSCPA